MNHRHINLRLLLHQASSRSIALVLTTMLTIFMACPSFSQSSQNGDAIRLYNQAIDSYTKGDTAQALTLFEKATVKDPTYSDAFYNLGSIYYQLRQYDKAETAFSRSLDLNTDDYQAMYNLALTLDKLGRVQEASDYLKKIPASDRKYAQAQQKLTEWLSKLPSKTAYAKPANPSRSNTLATQKPVTEKQQPQTNTATATTTASSASVPTHLTKKPVETTTKTPTSLTEPSFSAKPFAQGFAGPTGLAIAPDGGLFVANYSKNVIYKVDTKGIKSIFAQSDTLKGPVGMVLDPRNGNLYVANYLGNSIARVSPEGRVNVLVSGLNKPYYLMLDTISNALFISEQETNTVSKVDLNR
ncbi:MAG: tetratricopeptide repeat protein [Cyanobacteria bacterium]|nr:tetratricopeptide repeat protein [Cyanobacteriota bacterium]